MRGRPTHDEMELAQELRPRTLRRLSTLQPYVPGRGTLAITPAPSPMDYPPAPVLTALTVELCSVADLCDRIASAGDAPAAARLVIETLPHVLRIEHLRLSLEAPELTLDARFASSDGATSRRLEGRARATRLLWLLSSPAPRQIHTAHASIEAGGTQFGWAQIERAAESFDVEERGCLRIVATALGQRRATLAALEQISALSAHGPDGEHGCHEHVDGGGVRRKTSERMSPRDLECAPDAVVARNLTGDLRRPVLDKAGVELGPCEQTREDGNDAANRRGR